MRIPEETITQITERLDIAELIGQYVALSKKGSRYWGLCPFHSEKTPSFSVTPEKGIYYCFGCHKGGSMLTFIMEYEKLSFIEAVEFAAKKAGVEISLHNDQPGAIKKDAFLELNRRVTHSFEHFLHNHEKGEEARRYLHDRKIGEEIQKVFSLGYAPPEREWLFDFLKTKNYSEEFLSLSGLFVREKQAYFHHRIMFPIMNYRDEVVAFGGRAFGDNTPKYLNSPETSFFQKGGNLYGINLAAGAIKKQGFFYLVEGYMDVIAMHAAGISNCVAPLGTALTERQARLLKRYANKARLLFDADDAGSKATLRALEILETCGMETEVVELTGRKDPAEIFEKDGGEALQKVLKYTINGFQYILKRAMTQYDTTTPAGKEGVIAFFAPFLEKLQSQVRQDAYIEMAADALGAKGESIRHDLARLKRAPLKFAPQETDAKQYAITDETLFMLAVAIYGRAFEEVRTTIRLEDLEDVSARELYVALEECFRNDENTIEQLARRIDSDSLKLLLLEKSSSDEFAINQEEYITSSIRRIRRKSLERRQVAVQHKLKECEKQQSDSVVIRELQLEIMNIDEELKKLKAREYGRDN